MKSPEFIWCNWRCNDYTLSGTGDSRIDSRESFAIETPIVIARQADSHGSLEFPIRANHATKITPINS